MSEEVRYKGRFIRRKELIRKEKVRKANIKRNKTNRDNVVEEHRVGANRCTVTGNRIVNIAVLAKNLKCRHCNQRLGLDQIVSETREGLHSIFLIECDTCKLVTCVNTGNYHAVKNETSQYLKDKKHNDVTASAVLGTTDAGVGLTELNKILACCDIPTISPNTYKRYEKEVGAATEMEAILSCKRAAEEERQLVLDNLQKLYKEL